MSLLICAVSVRDFLQALNEIRYDSNIIGCQDVRMSGCQVTTTLKSIKINTSDIRINYVGY